MFSAPLRGPPRKEAFAITTASVTIQQRPNDWWQAAACTGAATELFFGDLTDQAQAAMICRRCPAAEPCLWAAILEEYGHPDHHRFGVRGGALPGARTRLARILSPVEIQARYTRAVHEIHNRPGVAA